MQHKQTALLRVLLDLVLQFEPDCVLLENVPCARTNGQLDYIKRRLGKKYIITDGNFSAASVGMQHYRNRMFVLAIKKGSAFGIPQLPPDCLDDHVGCALGAEPPRCVKDKVDGRTDVLHALGNAVVPAVVLLAVARLSSQHQVILSQPTDRIELVFDASLYVHSGPRSKRRKLDVLKVVQYRRLWASPRASSWSVYNELTARGLWDLGSQVRFEKGTIHRDWHVSPCWVAWLMGYPAGYLPMSFMS
jgi:hypothetical protein